MRSSTILRYVTALAAVVAAAVLAGCAPPQPGPELLGAGDCIPDKDGLTWFRWDGEFGPAAHLTVYIDADCTDSKVEVVDFMTFDGPVPQLPPGETDWLQLNAIETRDAYIDYGSNVAVDCRATYIAATGITPTGSTAVQAFGILAAVPNDLPDNLWGCIVYHDGNHDPFPPWPRLAP